MKILVINPGSTSTKVALFEDDKELVRESLSHSKEDLAKFAVWTDQLDYRSELVMNFVKNNGLELKDLDCVMSRGGSPVGILAGATLVDENLCESLLTRPMEPHPASLGPVIAKKIADEVGIKAYVYDPITANEMNPLARVYGVKGIEHESMLHVLNTHAMGLALAKKLGVNFNDQTYIIAHLGGGTSIGLWEKGHPTDVVPGDACTFSSERAGFMRSEKMVQLVQEYGAETCIGWLHGKGGCVSLLGTNDLRDVEKMIVEGNEEALKVEQAMAYHLAKAICKLLPVVYGKVDGIILTGGGAYWERLTNDVKERLEFTNIPFYLMPGENEMQSLAEGAVRVMRGEEEVHIYNG